ncbi:hypothetical protein [Acidianus sp. HS-5]|uniref:hypothetical protein n=1 Tax=Acidianus sp. HS-5 TaxID=2886040 RepID=UPI001F339749|nr:hypothetical protein [Acidianus sp. HS-5]BDC17710.1 hypothetical protein HS5_06000 [Acidianus sp. HS-5]
MHSPALTALIILIGVVVSTLAVVYIAYTLVSNFLTQQSYVKVYSLCVFENGTVKVYLFSPQRLQINCVKINGEVFHSQLAVNPGTNTYYINTGEELPQSKVTVKIFFSNGEEVTYNTSVVE